MTTEIKPIRTKRSYETALKEIGAKAGTPAGDRLAVLAALIDAYEAEHYPMDPPSERAATNAAASPPKTKSATASCRSTQGRQPASNLLIGC